VRLLVILVVCGGIAIGLRAIDALPPWWLGEPRSPIEYGTVQELERQQATRLLLPFFFPDTVVWPPQTVAIGPGTGRPVLLEFRRADGDGLALVLAQTLDGDRPIPERFVAPAQLTLLPEAAIPGEADIRRGVALDGREFLEFSDVVEGRRVVLRWFDGDHGPLRRMARSLRRR
jgi:hypothetical protein